VGAVLSRLFFIATLSKLELKARHLQRSFNGVPVWSENINFQFKPGEVNFARGTHKYVMLCGLYNALWVDNIHNASCNSSGACELQPTLLKLSPPPEGCIRHRAKWVR